MKYNTLTTKSNTSLKPRGVSKKFCILFLVGCFFCLGLIWIHSGQQLANGEGMMNASSKMSSKDRFLSAFRWAHPSSLPELDSSLSSALVREEVPHKAGIPLVLHSSHSNPVNFSSWISHNPGLEVIYYDDNAMNKFVYDNFHHFDHITRDIYDQLTVVEKSDLFRYLVVYVRGGFWADADVTCVRPIEKWWSDYQLPAQNLQELDFIFAIEFPREAGYLDYGVYYPLQFLQWTFAAAPGNIILKKVMQSVEHAILTIPQELIHRSQHLIVKRTGPAPWTETLYKLLGNLPDLHYKSYSVPKIIDLDKVERKVGQILEPIIDNQVLKCVLFPRFALEVNLVKHHYKGSWKPIWNPPNQNWDVCELIKQLLPNYNRGCDAYYLEMRTA